jgi:hypothetical protein
MAGRVDPLFGRSQIAEFRVQASQLLGLNVGDMPKRLGSLHLPRRGTTMTKVRVTQLYGAHLVLSLPRS